LQVIKAIINQSNVVEKLTLSNVLIDNDGLHQRQICIRFFVVFLSIRHLLFYSILFQISNLLVTDFPAQLFFYSFFYSFVHKLYTHFCTQMFTYFPRCASHKFVIHIFIYYVNHFQFIVLVNCILDFPFMFACDFPGKFAIDILLEFSINC